MRNALSLLLALSLVACAADATESSKRNAEEAQPTTNVSANAADGNSTTGAASAKNPWLGTWSLGGTQSTTCGPSSSTNQLDGVVIVTSGDDGKLETRYSDTCTITWSVKDNKATVDKDQVCTVAINGFNVTVTFTSGTMNLNGTAITALTSGATNNGCSFTQQETLNLM